MLGTIILVVRHYKTDVTVLQTHDLVSNMELFDLPPIPGRNLPGEVTVVNKTTELIESIALHVEEGNYLTFLIVLNDVFLAVILDEGPVEIDLL